MDLLSVVMHEMGHLLGLEHDEEGVMAETLSAGTRPEAGRGLDADTTWLGSDALFAARSGHFQNLVIECTWSAQGDGRGALRFIRRLHRFAQI